MASDNFQDKKKPPLPLIIGGVLVVGGLAGFLIFHKSDDGGSPAPKNEIHMISMPPPPPLRPPLLHRSRNPPSPMSRNFRRKRHRQTRSRPTRLRNPLPYPPASRVMMPRVLPREAVAWVGDLAEAEAVTAASLATMPGR